MGDPSERDGQAASLLATKRFAPEESFDKRLTPVVPAPEHPSTRPGPDGVTLEALSASVPAGETKEAGEATAVTPSQRKISISLAPSPTSEHSFFDMPPKYSVPPPSFSEPPLPKPSRLRSLSTKFLFVLALCAAVTLLCYEVSIAYRIPWLDPRSLIGRIRFG
jgi:hypothetical protein